MAKGRKDLAGQARPDNFGVQFCVPQSVLFPSLMPFISCPLDDGSQPANQWRRRVGDERGFVSHGIERSEALTKRATPQSSNGYTSLGSWFGLLLCLRLWPLGRGTGTHHPPRKTSPAASARRLLHNCWRNSQYMTNILSADWAACL